MIRQGDLLSAANLNAAFLSKTDTTSQTVAGPVTFNGELTITGRSVIGTSLFVQGGSGQSATPTITLAIGDHDTGLHWVSDGNLAVYTNNVERIRITSGGNVGIGTTSPSYKLDVSGDVRWSGALQGGTVPWARLSGVPTASTSQAGIVQLTDSVSSTSTTTAATPNSVKQAYDLAASKVSKSGDTMTGDLAVGSGPLDTPGVSARLNSFDTRSNNYNPEQYNRGLVAEFKYNSTIGISGEGSYSGIITYRQWGTGADWSGGGVHQFAFGSSGGIYHRYSQTTGSWGAWEQIWTSNNDGAGSSLDADLLDGMQPSTSASANTIAQRDGSGNLTANQLVGTARTGHRLGDSTDTGRALSILNSQLGAGEGYYLTLGKANSANNQAEISYYHAGDGSASNELRLGFYGNPDFLRIRADGRVMPKRVLDLNAVSTARLVLPVGADKYAT